MTKHVSIRPFHPNDAETYHAIAYDPATLAVYPGMPIAEIGETVEWAKTQQPGLHRLVIERDGTAVGFGRLQQTQRPRRFHAAMAEWLLHPDHRDSELSEQLLAALLDLADNWLDLRRVEVQLIAGDEIGRRVVEQAGFALEGVCRHAVFGNGRFQDIEVFSRVRGYTLSPATEDEPSPRPQRALPTIHIRTMRPEYAADLYEFYHLPIVVRTLNQLPSQEYSVVAERTPQYMRNLYRLVAEVDGRIVGNITLHRSDNPRTYHSGGFGMAVHPDYWGMGVGKRLLGAMVDLADNWLNLQRIELEVYPHNTTAIRLYEKLGFVIEGRRRLYSYGDGRWNDAYFMARLRPF